MTQPRHLILNAFLMSTGHHEASWRLPESDPFAHLDVAHFQRLAQIAERGKLDSVFFADSPVLWGDIGRRPVGRPRADRAPDRDRDGDQPDRPGRDRVHDVQRPVQPGPALRLRRRRQRRPRRLERRDHRRPRRRRQLRAGRPARAQRALRARRRVPRGGLPALGQLGRRRAPRRQGVRRVGRPVADPRDRPRRPALPRPRPAQPAALAAGPPGDRPGRLVRGRQGPRVAARGGRLHRPADPRRRAGVLPRPQAPDGRDRPRPRQHQDPARHRAGDRRHRGGGPAPRARARRADPPGVRRRPARAHPQGAARGPARSTSSCPPTSPTRTRSRGPRAATR